MRVLDAGTGDDQVDQQGRGRETIMDVQGFVAAGLEPVRECFAEILGRQPGTGLGGSYGGTSTAGGYTVGFLTGTVGGSDRAEALENTLRGCLGVAPLTATGAG